MRIEVRARDFSVTEAISSYATERVRLSLSRFRPRVTRVTVRLANDQGPRGSLEKRCVVELRLTHLEPIAVSAVEASGYEAIDSAMQKAERAASRRLARASRLVS
ncbi:MAG: HPF/RaiA family ribosome-associated protein [Myxococcota bacterium]